PLLHAEDGALRGWGRRPPVWPLAAFPRAERLLDRIEHLARGDRARDRDDGCPRREPDPAVALEVAALHRPNCPGVAEDLAAEGMTRPQRALQRRLRHVVRV